MKLKLFFARSVAEINVIEDKVNEFLANLPFQANVSVNTAMGGDAVHPTVVITIWHGE